MDADRALFSPHWHAVAQLKPRVRAHVRVRRTRSRGRWWFLLVDEANARVHRLDPTAWAFVGLCNGERSVEAIWEANLASTPDGSVTQNEAIALLAHLRDAGLLQVDLPVDAAQLAETARASREKERASAFNPFAFRVRLGDPSALLSRWAPWAVRLPTEPLLAAWVLLVGAAALCALLEAPQISAHAALWMGTPRYLLLLWLLYPPMKALHECAHAVVVRSFGGQVREVGITLMLLTPLPYVDASASNAFVRRQERALVAAAGIMVELALAALALFVWVNVADGLLRDAAFVVMFIGGASTLLVNGNPLVRMDGYHLLTDVADLPNLSHRSQAWWHARWRRALTGRPGTPLRPAPGEAPWLVLYAPVSWLYRAVLAVWIVGWLGSVQAWLGEAVAVLFAWQLLGAPLLAARARLRDSPLNLAARRRARRIGVASAAALLGVAVLLPLPDISGARGVVWLPEDAWVRTGTEGEFVRLLAEPGQQVRRGQDIAELVDEQVVAEKAAARERLHALTAQLYAELAGGQAKSGALAAQIEAAQASLAALEARVQGLRLKSPADGRFSVDRPEDLPGRWLQRGAAIGYVLPAALTTVRIALPGEDARAVASHLSRVELRTWDQPGRVVRAEPRLTVPAATRRLPAKTLGTAYGGDIVVDPADKEETATREPIVVLDLEAQEPLGLRIGTRVSVRLVRGDAPMAVQLARRARQLMLGHFNAGE